MVKKAETRETEEGCEIGQTLVMRDECMSACLPSDRPQPQDLHVPETARRHLVNRRSTAHATGIHA